MHARTHAYTHKHTHTQPRTHAHTHTHTHTHKVNGTIAIHIVEVKKRNVVYVVQFIVCL